MYFEQYLIILFIQDFMHEFPLFYWIEVFVWCFSTIKVQTSLQLTKVLQK